jgi:subtilisin family serine protease
MRRAFALVAVAGSLGLAACLPSPGPQPPSPPQPPIACGAAAAAAPEPPGEPIPPEEAGDEAREAVAENDTRAPDGSIPLVTVEATPAGTEIETTPVADADQAAAVAEDAAADGDLVVVEVDGPVHATADPLRSQQWALDQVHYEAAWPTTAGAGVTVAIVDTGVQENDPTDANTDQPDFALGQVLPGQVFLNQQPGVPGGQTDDFGHGTHVAGIVGAQANNGIGIHGAAPGVAILPVKVLDNTGSGFNSDVAKGIQWAADNGADVINLSLGGPVGSSAEQVAIQNARAAGAVVVAAAGNECQTGNQVQYPGAFPEVIAVGALEQDGDKATFSSTGSYLDLAAPGVGILSTLNTGSFDNKSGTSMATPYVAAAAALVRAQHGLSAIGVCNQLIRTADDLGASGFDTSFGHGLVDPLEAVGPVDAAGPTCT